MCHPDKLTRFNSSCNNTVAISGANLHFSAYPVRTRFQEELYPSPKKKSKVLWERVGVEEAGEEDM
jgi:hypothetical protein